MAILPGVHVYFMYRQCVRRFFTPDYGPFRRRDSRNLRFSSRFLNEALQLTAVCVESAYNGGHLRAYLAISARRRVAPWRAGIGTGRRTPRTQPERAVQPPAPPRRRSPGSERDRDAAAGPPGRSPRSSPDARHRRELAASEPSVYRGYSASLPP